jgi:hypothetical protein
MNRILTEVEEMLPDFWACALAYGDTDTFTDEDMAAFLAWNGDHIGWNMVHVGEDREFRHTHDASKYGVLACDCCTYTFHVYRKWEKKHEK